MMVMIIFAELKLAAKIWTLAPWRLTVVVQRFLVRVALGDHHGQDDVLESRRVKHTGVLHVGQIGLSVQRGIERNIPINKRTRLFDCIKQHVSTLHSGFPLTHHSCEVVAKSATSWKTMTMPVWMKMLPRTGRASRLAGGLHEYSSSLGPPRPITMASTVMRQMSRYRNCRSLMFVFSWRRPARGYDNREGEEANRRHEKQNWPGKGFYSRQRVCAAFILSDYDHRRRNGETRSVSPFPERLSKFFFTCGCDLTEPFSSHLSIKTNVEARTGMTSS